MSRSSGSLTTVSMRSARPSFEIQLDAAVLIGEIEPHLGAFCEDAGAEDALCVALNPTSEQHGDDVESPDGMCTALARV
jgi:hypothetical protein